MTSQAHVLSPLEETVFASAREARFAVVTSRFNEAITKMLHQGCIERLQAHGIAPLAVTSVWVPGAREISVAVQALLRTKRYHCAIALGVVIQGETPHFEDVCQSVREGCLRVSLDEGLPVISNVLTTYTIQQAWDRVGGVAGHKGQEAADAACQMVHTLRKIAQECA